MTEERYFDMKGLQAYLKVSRHTISGWIKERSLPFTPITKRTYRFDREQIDRWMREHSIATVEEQIKKIG